HALLLRRQPVMQRQRVAFVLEDDARTRFRDGGKLPLHAGVERREPRRFRGRARNRAELGAVAADRGQLQRRENEIELVDRSAAYKGDGTPRALPESSQCLAQRVRDKNLAWCRGE